MVEIEHLVKRYGKVTAVDDVTLAIDRGAFYGLLGPNGAGKSTLIGCMTGTHTLTGGTIRIGGHDVVRDYRAARRVVGLSSQEFNVNPFESTENLIAFMAGFHGMRGQRRRDRVEAMLEQFKLIAHREKQFRELSGGLKRRAVLARALVHDPELLILDEPTAGIDVEERRELWRYLRELNEAGKTIILTSHYLEEVELLCGRVAVINHGRIVAEGTKEDYLKEGRSLEEEYLAITQGANY